MSRSSPTALVTGANSGVGFATTRRLLASGWRVVMACRSRERGEEAVERLGPEVEAGAPEPELELADLAELEAVEALASRVTARHDRLDGLVLNAGLYAPRLERTADGFERTMAVNHLAHVLLTLRLAPALLEASGRVVTVASVAHRRAELRRAPLADVLDGSAWRRGMVAYGDSKLANVLFAFELDRRLKDDGVRADAVHPGVLATRIWENATGVRGLLARVARLFMGGAEEGGEAVARLLLDPALASGGGRYFEGIEEAEPSGDARNPELAEGLWDATVEALGVSPPPRLRRR